MYTIEISRCHTLELSFPRKLVVRRFSARVGLGHAERNSAARFRFWSA